MVLSFAGPFFSVSGVALANVFILELFTDFIYLGGHPLASSDRVIRVAKIFDVVADAMRDLEEYYRTTAISQDLIHSRLMPKPVPRSVPLPDNELVFLRRFQYAGNQAYHRRSIFHGKYRGKRVLVKFRKMYNRVAHELLSTSRLSRRGCTSAPRSREES